MGRDSFWRIEHEGLFYGLAAVAMAVFALGLVLRVREWRRHGVLPTAGALLRGALRSLSPGRLLRGDRAGGWMHGLVLWGFGLLFVGTVLDAVDEHLVSFLEGTVYLVYSVVLEVAGLALQAGLAWAALRRLAPTPSRVGPGVRDLGLLAWLSAVVLTGFATEAARLAATVPAWGGWSFAGWALRPAFPHGSEIHPTLWWLHAVLALGLVGAFPWLKLKHALSAPFVLAEHAAPARAPDAPPALSLLQHIQLDACTECGRCSAVCPPALAGEPFDARSFLLATAAGTAHHPWSCTTCGACQRACPLDIHAGELVAHHRQVAVEEGTTVPEGVAGVLETLFKYDNPWEPSKKAKKAFHRSLPQASTDVPLWFVGCTAGVDTRAAEASSAFAGLLRASGTAFGTLGAKEPCCGHGARVLGERGLWTEQQEALAGRLPADVPAFSTSPHCWTELRALRPDAEHSSQLLARLLRSGALALPGRFEATVTLHDPCWLGRLGGETEAPREVLRRVPGLRLVEMQRHGADSQCCGGGGGRAWHEPEGGRSPGELRLQQALATGAEIVVTACPLCLVMLEAARKSANQEDRLRILDLAEVLALAMEVPA